MKSPILEWLEERGYLVIVDVVTKEQYLAQYLAQGVFLPDTGEWLADYGVPDTRGRDWVWWQGSSSKALVPYHERPQCWQGWLVCQWLDTCWSRRHQTA